MKYSNKAKSKYNNQQGSALMLALFVIIVVLLLGSALVKVLSTSSESVAQEVIGTRALMAANSAMQAELQQLFPLSTDPLIPLPAGTCNANNFYSLKDSYGDNIAGLYHCSATTECQLYHVHESVNYYRLTSTGECGSSAIAEESIGIVRSSRTVQVEARSL